MDTIQTDFCSSAAGYYVTSYFQSEIIRQSRQKRRFHQFLVEYLCNGVTHVSKCNDLIGDGLHHKRTESTSLSGRLQTGTRTPTN